MKKQNKVKPTERQVKAVNLILAGKKPTVAMREAGFSPKTSKAPSQKLVASRGVQEYLKKFDKATRQKFGMNLGDKLVDVYTNGLSATKLTGKDAIEHDDFPTQYLFANKLSEFLGWTKSIETPSQNNSQYNFFNITSQERSDFNQKLKKFIKENYS